MGYPTVQLCAILDISVYIISEVKLIIKVLGYSLGNFRLALYLWENNATHIFLISDKNHR